MYENDKKALINIYKKLDLFIDDKNALNLMSNEATQDLKIMIWSIKEIYQSPHRVLLNTLKKDTFRLKYYKAKKYIEKKDNHTTIEIINYFIKCLQNEMEGSDEK